MQHGMWSLTDCFSIRDVTKTSVRTHRVYGLDSKCHQYSAGRVAPGKGVFTSNLMNHVCDLIWKSLGGYN